MISSRVSLVFSGAVVGDSTDLDEERVEGGAGKAV